MSQDLSNSFGDFAELVAAGTPTPGGGSVAAYCGVLAASLGEMVCNLTIGKTKYAGVEPRIKELKAEISRLGERLRRLVAEDAASFEAVLAARRLPKDTEEQKDERTRQINAAEVSAVETPLTTARVAFDLLPPLAELSKIGNQNALSDLAVGARLSEAAVKGAYYNIAINLETLPDREFAERVHHEITELLAETERRAADIESILIK